MRVLCKVSGAVVFLMVLALLVSCLVFACATGGGVATSAKTIDWTVTDQYYKTYVEGYAPLGLDIAALTMPEAIPAIIIAKKEVGNLGALISAKANDASVMAQTIIVSKAITDANVKVGKILPLNAMPQ